MSSQTDLCRLLFETASDAILVIRTGRIADCNASAATLFAAPLEALLGQTLSDFSPPTQPDGRASGVVLQERMEAALTGESQRFEWLCRRVDGETFYAEIALTPVKFENDWLIQASIHAITQYKLIEESLRENEERFRAIFEGSNDAVMLLTEQGFFDCNQRTLELFGIASKEEFITSHPANISPPFQPDGQDSWSAAQAKIQIAFQQGYTRFEWVHSRRNGEDFPAEVLLSAFKFGGETVLQARVRDITEQKQAEEVFRESEAKFRLLYEQSPDAILILDGDQFIDCNPAALKMMRAGSREELLNHRLSELSPERQPDGRLSSEKAAQMIEIAFREGTWRFEWVHWRVDGEEFPVEVTLIKVPLEGREVLYTEWRDISRRKQMERDLQLSLARRQRQLQLSNDVAQEIVMADRIEDLYGRVTTLIMQYLDCAHTQLFVCQAGQAAARLVAGDIETTEKILSQGYRISVGAGSVGAVLATGDSILHADTSTIPDKKLDSLIPQARSEIVVPIKIGGETLEAQLRGLSYFIDHNFDGWAVYPIDAGVIQPVARQAVESGSKVVSLHSDMGGASQTGLIQLSDREMGYQLGLQAGAWAKDHLPARQKLKLGVLNYRFNPQVRIREEGILAGIRASFGDNIEIVGSEQATEPAPAVPTVERWLEAHPDLKMVVAINDGGALGAHRAVIAAGKDRPDTFFVGGIDATDEALTAIRQGGAYQATVDIKPRATGVLLVRLLAATIKGKPSPHISSIPAIPVNRHNLEEVLISRQAAIDIPVALELEEELAGLDFRGIKLGLSVLDLNNPYFATLAQGAKAEAARLGVELIINDPKQVLGLLAIQDNLAGALRREDQLVLEGVASQLATAFESLRLRREMEERLAELNALQRLMVRESWRDFESVQPQIGYLFDQITIQPIESDELVVSEIMLPSETQASSVPAGPDGRPVSKPLTVSGESIGVLGVYDDHEQSLTPEDQAFLDSVAIQVAEALERARLLEQSQTALAETEMLYRLAQELAQASDPQGMFEFALSEYLSVLNLPQGGVLVLDEDKAFGTLKALVQGGQPVEPGLRIPVRDNPAMQQLLITKEPVIINDALHDELLLPVAELTARLGYKSMLLVPIIERGEVIGALGADSPDRLHRFSEREVALVRAVADQLGIAMENQRLLTETRRALTERESMLIETENLYKASHRINEARDLPELVAAVVEAGSVSAINRVILFEFEYNSLDKIEAMIVVANWYSGQGTPPTPIGTRYPASVFTVIDIFLAPEPAFFADVQQDERVDAATRELMERINVRTWAILPLQAGARQWGILMLEGQEPHHFTEREMQPYIALARQLAVALENRHLLSKTQAALAEVESMQRRYTIQAWESYYTRQTSKLYQQVKEGVSPLNGEVLPEMQQAVSQKKSVVTSSISVPPARVAAEAEVKSSLIVPLTVRDAVIGVLGLQDIDEHPWLPEEVALAEAIAEQVAQAAEQLRLFDETQQRAAREKRVNEISEKIQAAQSLEEALKIAVKEVGLSLQAPQTTVQLEVK
ncbi:MAG: GAF domain-containing protein [Chloroflexota bacterium]